MKFNKLRLYGCAGLILVLTSLYACSGENIQHERQMAEATRDIGEAYMRQGDYTAALRELIKAEKMNPEDPFVHNDLGLCYMYKKRIPDAIAHFKKAIALKASYTPARNNLGTAYLAAKSWDAAIAVFKEITRDVLYATPHYPLSNLGLAYYHKGEYRTALGYYKDALKIQPDFVPALLGAGRAYVAMNQGRLALHYLKEAARLAPKIADIHFSLAEAYLLMGHTDQARMAYETVIDLAPPESELANKAKQRLGAIR